MRYGILLCAVCALAWAQAYDGLTLVNTMGSRTCRLVTNDGQTVNTWNCNSGISYVPYLMPDSTIWRPGVYSGASMRGAAYGGLIEHYDWNGNVIESFIWSNAYHQQHHDIHPMPNGHVLVVSWDRKTRAQAESLGRQGLTGDIWPDEVIEWDPVTRSVVWEWHFWDHLIQDVDPAKPNYGVIRDHPERLNINLGTVMGGDWMHCNTVDYNEERDEIILTSHNLHEIYVIDHSTTTEEARGSTGGRHGKGGDILYRWGNPQNYGRGTSADRVFYVIHGGNWVRPGMPGAGNILVLNNGDRPGTSNDYSVITEITPPLDSEDHYYIHPDSAFGPTAPTWTYQNGSAFYAQHLGGAYRLPNGNTMAILGSASRLVEVTPAGQVVWTYNTGGQIGRALKYPRDFAVGTEEQAMPGTARPFLSATIVRNRLLLPEPPGVQQVRGILTDALGRKVMNLAPGANDVHHLAPGVYFAQLNATTGDNVAASATLRIVKGE
ncbi:MAG: aryl-sulfate sulfotransferase [candidate division WOR-3 bacterium]